MKKFTKTPLQLATLFLALGVWTLSSCGGGEHGHDHDHDAGEHIEHAMDDAEEAMEDAAHAVEDAAEEAGDAAMEGMDKIEATWADGSMEKELSDFIATGSGTQTFALDKIPFEGEEISAEGKEQLDHLAQMLKDHPELNAEIQGHTTAADNAIGRTGKKTASGTRAIWVKTKLVFRGVDGKQLSTKGYADEQLLEGIDPKDDAQKRLLISLTK
ncbi:MAG: OmpA family protein [Flavobacteriales bacterium]